MTTRATPAATRASAQGGVRPWWEQGSRVQTTVAPRAASPAAARAIASACGRPGPSCQPSATISLVAQHHRAHQRVGAHAAAAVLGQLARPRQGGPLGGGAALTRAPAAASSRYEAATGSAAPEDRRGRDEHARARVPHQREGVAADAAVDLDRHPVRQQPPQALHPARGARDERLAGEARVDGQHVDVVELGRPARPRARPGCPGLTARPARQPASRIAASSRCGCGSASTWTVIASPASREQRHDLAGAGHHQVHVHEAPGGVDRLRRRPARSRTRG